MNKLSMFLAGSALALMVGLPQLSRATGGGQSLRMSVKSLTGTPDAQTPIEAQNAKIAALESKFASMQNQITALQQEVGEANKKLRQVDYKVSCHWHTLPVPPYAIPDNQTRGLIGLYTERECDPQYWQ